MVPKKNNKWRACIDFRDLNKPCPKDFFLHPKIDKLVDANERNQLFSFMDAYFGYNQIPKYEPDQVATFFFNNQGLYYYKVMSLSLRMLALAINGWWRECSKDVLGTQWRCN